MTVSLVIGAEKVYLPAESGGVRIDVTELIGITTIIDTQGKPPSAEINIDVSTAEGKKVWKSIISGLASRSTKKSDVGTT